MIVQACCLLGIYKDIQPFEKSHTRNIFTNYNPFPVLFQHLKIDSATDNGFVYSFSSFISGL